MVIYNLSLDKCLLRHGGQGIPLSKCLAGAWLVYRSKLVTLRKVSNDTVQLKAIKNMVPRPVPKLWVVMLPP